MSPSYVCERCFFKERQTENHTNCSSDQGYRPFNISIKEKELLLLTVTSELHVLIDIKRLKTDRAFPGSCLDNLDEDSSSKHLPVGPAEHGRADVCLRAPRLPSPSVRNHLSYHGCGFVVRPQGHMISPGGPPHV